MAGSGKEMRQEVLTMKKETVIKTPKHQLLTVLADILVNQSDRAEFWKLCGRVESTIRAWYLQRFSKLLELYDYFDPVSGSKQMEKEGLEAEQIEAVEMEFVGLLLQLMDKSSFKVLTDAEYRMATSTNYMLNLPIEVDKSKIDNDLLSRFFTQNPDALPEMPSSSGQYLIFRRGVGLDSQSDAFTLEKVNVLIARLWGSILSLLRLRRVKRESVLQSVRSELKNRNIGGRGLHGGASPVLGAVATSDTTMDHVPSSERSTQISLERIRLENLPIGIGSLISKTTIQEPTFEQVIVLYRPGSPGIRQKATTKALKAKQEKEEKKKKPEQIKQELYSQRSIVVRQFEGIPMADIEIVLPEKKTPGLTPMDWITILSTAFGGLAALLGALELDVKFSPAMLLTLVVAVLGYISKVYFSFTMAMARYNALIMKVVYSKQLDSGRGTLLSLCHQVIEQEIKEVIVAFFILMTQGKATSEELDERCEDLMAEEFGELLDFDVSDATSKLSRFGIVTMDNQERYTSVPMKRANDILGVSTDEIVSRVLGAP